MDAIGLVGLTFRSQGASAVARFTVAREARAVGARPAFVLLPAWNELGAVDPAPLPTEAFVLGIAARENVPCLRLRPLFLERARLGAEFEQVGHWGALEHRLAADIGANVGFRPHRRVGVDDRQEMKRLMASVVVEEKTDFHGAARSIPDCGSVPTARLRSSGAR